VTCEHSGDLYNVMHKLSGHLQLIDANDNSGNYDDHKPPGGGNIDWKRLLTELSQIEFHGGFILELSGNKEPEIALAEARGARRYRGTCARFRANWLCPAHRRPMLPTGQGSRSVQKRPARRVRERSLQDFLGNRHLL